MSESKQPPRLPQVVDEAGPTPSWVPWLGVGLLCAVVLLLIARSTGLLGGEPGVKAANAAADAGVAAPGAGGAAAPAPTAGAAKP